MVKRLTVLILCCSLLCAPVRAVENEKLVALTFDDGPSGRFTRTLLDGLEERGVHATFLLCGYRMEQYPELTERIFSDGHEIGLHGYSHKPMGDMCRWDTVQEIRRTSALLPEGCKASFLRPPGGLCSQCVQTVAEEFGLSILHWSVDPKDWATHNADTIKKEVLHDIRDGDVILLHDMSDSSVEAALAIVDGLQAQGYRFVTASELAEARGVGLTPGTKYSRFAP